MKRLGWTSLSTGVLMTVAMGVATPVQQGPQQPTRVIAKIRGDLYRFQNDAHYSWFLVTPEGVIVGDPINADAATWLKNEIAQRFKVPVRYVIYSHHHWDHASGARVFDDTAELVGHATLPAAIQEASANLQKGGGQRAQDRNNNRRIDRDEVRPGTATAALGPVFDRLDTNRNDALEGSEIMVDVRPPESTYTDRRAITLGGKTVELIHPGPIHSDETTVTYFPAERVVNVVDWLNVRTVPTGFEDAPLSQWIRAVKRVEALKFDLLIAGHGNIATKADVTDYRQYFEDLVAAVSRGIAAGRTVEQVQASDVLEKYSWWPNYTQARNTSIAEAYRLLSATSSRPSTVR